ncbi:MAG: oligosaccharide flippase family protein [Fidelibacterota bacterium]
MTFSFVKSSFLILIIANFASVAQYASQLILGRYLKVVDYGIFNAVNSLSLVVVPFVAVMPFIVSKYLIRYQDNIDLRNILLQKIKFVVLFSNLFLFVSLYLLANHIRLFLKIDSLTPIYIFIVLISLNVTYTLYDSVLQGLRMYVTRAMQSTALVLLRLLLILVLVVYLSHSYNAALLSQVFATIFVLTFIYFFTRKITRLTNKNIHVPRGIYKEMFHYSIPVAITYGILIIISYMDIPLVKHYFEEYQAGIYSSASIIGKIGFFLPTVLLHAFFPEVMNNDKLGKSSIPLLAFMLGITFLICSSYVLVVFFFKEIMITLLFGEKYLLAGEYLTRMTIFMSIVGVITVLFNFFLAKEIYHYLYISVFILVLGVLVFVFSEMNSPNDILDIFLNVSSTLLASTMLYTFFIYRKHLYGWLFKMRFS